MCTSGQHMLRAAHVSSVPRVGVADDWTTGLPCQDMVDVCVDVKTLESNLC